MSVSERPDARTRLAGLLDRAELDESTARWITSPAGLAGACREAVAAGDAALFDDPRIEDLFDQLDDRVAPLARSAPSVRADALVALARLLAGADDDPTALLARVARGFAPATADVPELIWTSDGLAPLAAVRAAFGAPHPHAPWLAGVMDLAAHFSGIPPPPPARSVAVTIATSRHVQGEVIGLTVTSSPDASGIAPDFCAAPFLRCDEHFAVAVASAAEAVGAAGTGLRWLTTSVRSGRTVEAVAGGSVGLGAALAIRRLHEPALTPIDPNWVFTGRIDRAGQIGSLHNPRSAQEYLNKLTACQDRTLVVPEADAAEVNDLVAANGLGVRVLTADRLDQAEALITRHLAGRAQYEQVLQGRIATAPRRRRWVGAGVLALAAVAALVIGLVLDHRHDAAAEARALAAGWGIAADVELVGETSTVQTTEATNRQWDECVRAGGCTSTVLYDASSPDVAHFPVRGITATQALEFCDWLGADLLTLEQWAGLVETESDIEYPVTAMNLQPARNELLGADEFDHLVGNVAEWTRTSCAGSAPCSDWESGPLPDSFEVVGVPFDAGAEREIEGPDEAVKSHVGASTGAFFGGLADVGVRCARQQT